MGQNSGLNPERSLKLLKAILEHKKKRLSRIKTGLDLDSVLLATLGTVGSNFLRVSKMKEGQTGKPAFDCKELKLSVVG